MESDLKFCKDCRWFPVGLPNHMLRFAGCQHPDFSAKTTRDLVTGREVSDGGEGCATMRTPDGECGPHAKLFEAHDG